MIVIDDTDHFASAESHGAPDEQSINNLYHYGVRTLAEFDELDIIVAIQPRFRSVARVAEVESRFHFQQVEVATLDGTRDEPPLGLVLARRLQASGIEDEVHALIDPRALAQLQAAYFMLREDMRRVLEITDQAAQEAVRTGDEQIGPRHVQLVLARS